MASSLFNIFLPDWKLCTIFLQRTAANIATRLSAYLVIFELLTSFSMMKTPLANAFAVIRVSENWLQNVALLL